MDHNEFEIGEGNLVSLIAVRIFFVCRTKDRSKVEVIPDYIRRKITFWRLKQIEYLSVNLLLYFI